jgi:hypothetical protein
MNRERLLQRAAELIGPAKQIHSENVTFFQTLVRGRPVTFKAIRESWDEEDNKFVTVVHQPLACGSVVDDPTQIVVIDGAPYARASVMRCPSCGELIRPGDGELIDNVWYHKTCADSPRTDARLRRDIDLAAGLEKLEGLRKQSRFTDVQITTAETRMALEEQREELQRTRLETETQAVLAGISERKQRLKMDARRERLQRAQITAQTDALQQGIDHHERRLVIEEERAVAHRYLEQEQQRLAERRQDFAEEEARLRQSQEEEAALLRKRVAESQLATEALRREIEAGRYAIELKERLKKLLQQ